MLLNAEAKLPIFIDLLFMFLTSFSFKVFVVIIAHFPIPLVREQNIHEDKCGKICSSFL